MESRSAGFSYLYRAIDRRWRSGVPAFRDLVIPKVPEATTRLASLRTGQVDALPIPPILVKQAEGLKDFRVLRVPGAVSTGFYFGGMWPPTNPKYDPTVPWLKLEVRKAVNLAINRQELVDTILQGAARPGTVHPYLVPGWEELKPYPYDPAQAGKLLADASYPRGFEATAWSYAVQPENPDLILAACAYWEQIGARCNVQPIDFGYFYPKWRAFDIGVTAKERQHTVRREGGLW